MKVFWFLFALLCLFVVGCTKKGTVIEVKETSVGKFEVVDERADDNSYVIVKYLNGSVKTMSFNQAEQFLATNPPSSPSNFQMINPAAQHQGGLSFSDLLLYQMMFGRFGGDSYHTSIINRYPSHYRTYNEYRQRSPEPPRPSTFSSRSSNAWGSSSSKSNTSSFNGRSSGSWSSPSQNSYSRPSSFSSRSSSSWGSSSSYSKPSSFGSRPSSFGSSSRSYSKPSSFGSRKR